MRARTEPAPNRNKDAVLPLTPSTEKFKPRPDARKPFSAGNHKVSPCVRFNAMGRSRCCVGVQRANSPANSPACDRGHIRAARPHSFEREFPSTSAANPFLTPRLRRMRMERAPSRAPSRCQRHRALITSHGDRPPRVPHPRRPNPCRIVPPWRNMPPLPVRKLPGIAARDWLGVSAWGLPAS